MHKFFLALILLSVPVSTSALAHSGTEQDEKACAPRRAAFLPQADGSGRFYHSGLPQGKSSKTLCRVPQRAGQPRAMTIGISFGVGCSHRSHGFGYFEIWWSDFVEKARVVHERSIACRSPQIR